ncbi:MAG TPA: NAD(P)-dependent alcohol dehydrogenase [Bdellovibrionales bacterium]|jgi:uncharacterized zinc-type alcohol dehydrogenase-like protein|nr:NAD(P)-dependent alcohol dehydrogenase [Bdellovibrionales bacterium]
MTIAKSYAAFSTDEPLRPYDLKRRSCGPRDVAIEILFCGVCHSDLHSVNGDWGARSFPLVPGHEIIGRVTDVGSEVKRLKKGDNVGVGCFSGSCRECRECTEGLEQYCDSVVATYGSPDRVSGGITQGGYSTSIVTDEHFVFSIPANLPLEKAAPLLCAGITTYSPLKHWNAGPGTKVAVAGLGGLGHIAIKIAASMGADVTVLSTSEKKREDAMKLGAHNFISVKDNVAVKKAMGSFDLILDTVSASHDYNTYLSLLKRDGTMVLLGLPEPQMVSAGSLIMRRRSLAGSLVGGVPETQEMLDYCAKHNISCDVEVIPMNKINEAYERMLKSDVRYRFVIDMNSLR